MYSGNGQEGAGFNPDRYLGRFSRDTKNARELFSYNFIKMLEKKDMSCAHLARELDMQATVVRRWADGSIPYDKQFKKLVEFFNVDIIDFFRRK